MLNSTCGEIRSQGATFRAVVIQGQPAYQIQKNAALQELEAGSGFSSQGKSVHRILSHSGETILYVRSGAAFTIKGRIK